MRTGVPLSRFEEGGARRAKLARGSGKRSVWEWPKEGIDGALGPRENRQREGADRA